jgi:hypothetical protein
VAVVWVAVSTLPVDGVAVEIAPRFTTLESATGVV